MSKVYFFLSFSYIFCIPEISESSTIENVESELEDNEYYDDEHETSSEEEDAFTMAFMDSDLINWRNLIAMQILLLIIISLLL